MPDDAVVIREYRPGDEVGILECYNRIFPDSEHGIPSRSAQHWAWKFGANPTGRVQHVVAEHSDHGIIGGYAGIPVKVWSEGRDQLAAQGVDLMVLPEWRRYGARPGLFVHIGWKFHELFCGADEGKVLFTYGWPVPAWRMGQRYLGYINIRDWDMTFRDIAPDGMPRSVSDGVRVQRVKRFGEEVDRLFDALRPTMGLAIVRDAQYLNWRYADHPERDYVLIECRDRATDALRGVAVATHADFLRPNTTFLVDWLAPAEDHDATVALVAEVESVAREAKTGLVASVWNHVDPRFLTMQQLGYHVRGTNYFLVLASFKYDTMYYRDQWYFTMGDSDLV